MLKPRGKFCLRDVAFSFDFRDYASFFGDYISKAAEKVGEEFAERIEAHIKNEYSTFSWIMEGMIQRAGFEILEKECFDGFIMAYFCI